MNGDPKIALLFPGQGSQVSGMGRAMAETFPEAAATFEEADSILGFSISELCFAGPDIALKPTEIAQPALLTCSIAVLRCIEQRLEAGGGSSAAAGHSVGEYSALVAAGVIPFADALRVVRQRGLLMAEAGERHPGAMAAVLGLNSEQVSELCQTCGDEGIVVAANLNAPGQVVISGSVEALTAAADRARAAGAARVIPLAVSGAFHSPLMQEAADQMAGVLQGVPMENARYPVVSNVTARAATAASDLRAALIRQIASPVRWEESVRTLDRLGATHYVEVGPGKVLCGLVRRILPGAATYNVGDPAALEGLAAFLGDRP